MTCASCPEQYDVWEADTNVGYLRLRWGVFTAHAYTEEGDLGECVYQYVWDWDGYKGEFDDQAERDLHIGRALSALSDHHGRV
jgi:hypothetical protein